MDFENKVRIGIGLYTPREVATILRLPYSKVKSWIDKYWDGELGQRFEQKYSWKVNNSQGVSFHTLIEFYVLMVFANVGVKTRKVLTAHSELMRQYGTPFPFAHKKVLKGIRTDGRHIYLCQNGHIITLDGTQQLNLDLLKLFFKKLDFDDDLLASRFWPLGKDRSILVDPKRKFGQPVINGYNIYPETLNSLHLAGDSIEYIAYLYEIDPQKVQDAVDYCQAA